MKFQSFLSSVIRDQDLNMWRKLDRSWLNEDEQPAYDDIQSFINEYDKLPEFETLKAEGLDLDPVKESSEFYLQGLMTWKSLRLFQKSSPLINECIASQDVRKATNELEKVINQVRSITVDNRITTIDDEAKASIQDYNAGLFGRNPLNNSVTLGWDFLDNLNGGLYPGQLMVICGMPEMGKTTMQMYMALQAWKQGNSMLVTSGEMTVRELTNRLLCYEAEVDSNKYLKRKLDYWSLKRVDDCTNVFAGRCEVNPIYFLNAANYGDDRETSILDIERIVAEKRPRVVYVDAVYLFTLDGTRKGENWQIIASVLNRLKAIAAKYLVSVVVTAQIAKQPDNQKFKRKENLDLTMIADTAVFGRIAHLVIGIRNGQGLGVKRTRIIDIMKNRDGPGTGDSHCINYQPEVVNFREFIELPTFQIKEHKEIDYYN